MKTFFLILSLITLSLQEGIFKKSELSKHGEDCVSDSACDEGLFCRLNRCMTDFESKNMKILGLYEKNICSEKNECPANTKCFRHRCIDISIPILSHNNTDNETDINILFAGSIYLKNKAYKSGIRANDTFDYNHLFTNILNDIKGADLSIVEQETVYHILPPGEKFIKKGKNTPKELGDAIANAGFNVVLHGTSHAFSEKEIGINNTLDFWRTNYPKIKPLGISKTLEESKEDYFVYARDNVKIGIINFSSSSERTIPKKSEFMLNIISEEKIKELVGKLKKETDFVIVCINWGEKKNNYPIKKQISTAKLLANYGVDLIIGSSLNYVQPVTYVKSDNGNKTLVFWSLGPFVGDNKRQKNNLGALANIVISKGKGKAYISSYNLIPIINHKADNNDYKVYKLSDYNEKVGSESEQKYFLKKIKETCKNVMSAFAYCD